MKDTLSQFLDRARQASLSEEERRGMRQHILDYMTLHPVEVRVGEVGRHQKQRRTRRIFTNRPIAMITSALIALLITGSVSYAAEGSLPGDTLYPLKVEVNERVMGALAITDEDEAEFALSLIEKRESEREALRNKGKLDDDTKIEIDSEVSVHVSEVESLAQTLRDDGKDDVATALLLEVRALVGEDSDDVEEEEGVTSGAASAEIVENTSSNTSENTSNNTSENSSTNTSSNTSNNTSENTSNNTSHNTSSNTSENTSINSSINISNDSNTSLLEVTVEAGVTLGDDD